MTAHKSEAHRRISLLVTEKGPAWIERKLELGEGTVRSWALKGRVPQKRIQKVVAERLGIGEELWTTPAGPANKMANISRPKSQSNGQTGEIAQVAGKPERGITPSNGVKKGEAMAPTDADDPRANAVATLRILRRALEEAEPEQIPSLANAVTSSSRLLARLSGSLDVTESQVVRSEAFGRVLKVLRVVLTQFPGAPAALDKAMSEYEARA